MTGGIEWLPDLVRLTDYEGDWKRYIAAVYGVFHRDFVASRPTFRGLPVFIKRQIDAGKERGFWHVVSEGPVEEDRLPDLRRCERIAWVRAFIEHADDPSLLVWRNRRGDAERMCIWSPDAEFLVVLEDRGRSWVLWTAYPVTEEHRKRKLRQEYESA